MKILQVGPIPPEVGGRTAGGVATHAWGLSCHLAKRGHEVAILANNFPNPPQFPVTEEGVRIYGSSISRAFILKRWPSTLLNLPTLSKLKRHFEDLYGIRGLIATLCYHDYVLRRLRPDVIHVHTMEQRFPYAYFMAKDRIPIVTTIHSFHSIKFLAPDLTARYRRLVGNNLKLARNLILVSEFLEKELNQFFGEYQGKCWVIHNPMDGTRYYPIPQQGACRERIGLPKDIPVLLFVGGLIRRKGEYVLLEAAKLLREKGLDFQVVIVGDGPEQEEVKDFTIEKGIEDVVRLEGAKFHPELLYYYNSADLFVMPSFSESFGIVYLEAMACGVPVIGTNVTGLPEILPSEDYGIIIPAGNAVALAEAVERGLGKKWDREKIVEYAHSFSWDRRVAEFEKIFESIQSRSIGP